MRKPPPTDSELARVCEFVYRRTGLVYGEAKRYYTERRVAQRMAATGAPDFDSYYARLGLEPAEVEALVNAFTVNETYFYREKHQLQTLSGSLLPIVTAGRTPGDTVRIWSMPCSTGEEPYSIAIWLLENWPLVDAYNIEIVGSDIDTAALDAAREGLYGERALARLPADVRTRYFERAGPERWELIPDLRESVRFAATNLVDPASVAAQGRFHIVFCRNLLIYFDERSRGMAIDNLYNAIMPGGFLLLGHTESLSKISDRLVVTRFKEGVVYRKPVDAA
jgi:chemotaxis protein methyltransferase CheR